MKQHIPVFLILLLLAGAGCAPTGPEAAGQQQLSSDPELFMDVGTVRYVNIEGGTYVIETDNGTRYNPVNLTGGYREEGLRIRFAARKLQMMGFHMWGTPIEIDEIWRL